MIRIEREIQDAFRKLCNTMCLHASTSNRSLLVLRVRNEGDLRAVDGAVNLPDDIGTVMTLGRMGDGCVGDALRLVLEILSDKGDARDARENLALAAVRKALRA